MTLIEIMIVMVIMALVAVAAGFAVLPALERARVRQAKTDASAIWQMVIGYQLEYAGECPTMQDLVDKHIQSASTASQDPWGMPFEIDCGDVEPTVTSAGPDKQLNTGDDISQLSLGSPPIGFAAVPRIGKLIRHVPSPSSNGPPVGSAYTAAILQALQAVLGSGIASST